ncbi:MAG: type II toxin-antitoxin system VapC family toxin [Candidatus Binatia bacterium]
MILVDTSVWIDHFRRAGKSRGLADLLEEGEVGLHPFVLGEIALGHLGSRRVEVLRDLTMLPRAGIVPDDEVLEMVTARDLSGTGIGWVDAHLIASALERGWRIWTFDRALFRVAARLRIGAPRT